MTTFSIGNKFENLASAGYIWVITAIVGNNINMESEADGQVAKSTMPKKDLQAMITGGYFQPIK